MLKHTDDGSVIDIVKGKRSVEDARQFYAKTAMEAMKGQVSPYD